MEKRRVWTVIGGGAGGQTLAGHLALMGERVRLHSKSQEKIDTISKTNAITLRNNIEGVGKLEFATTDMAKAIDGANNIVIVQPSTWHEMTAHALIPHLVDGQNILILPEASCGALAFRKYMKDLGCTAKVVVGASATLPYATRLKADGECFVFQLKKEVEIAALPASDNEKLLRAFTVSALGFHTVPSVLHTSIENPNAVAHGPATLLNVARIEARPFQPYEYYYDGATPTICQVMEAVDEDRRKIAAAFGFEQRSMRQAMIDMYACGTPEDSLYDIFHNCEFYHGLMADSTIRTRHVMEDVPYSLVAIRALGEIAGVETPAIDTIIQLAKIMIGKDLDEGRTTEHLGIKGMTKDELIQYIYG